jgi:GMP synthase-like glutamine amidotransferase
MASTLLKSGAACGSVGCQAVGSSRILVVHNDVTDPVARLGDWLRAAGAELEIVEPFRGEPLPADLAGYDGLVVMGGFMSADDDVAAPWLPELRRLMSVAVATEVPTLGICLGGQLLALANGGQVGPNPDGPEIGAQLIAKRANAATDPLFGTMPITPDVIQWHYDAVTRLPVGAVLLANSPGCEVQAFRLGRLAWGTQFHIETTPELVREWAAAELADYDTDRLLARSDAAHEDIAEVWQPFAVAFARVVADPASVKAARPLRMSTAEPVTDPAEIRAALAEQMQAARQPLPWPGAEPADPG